MARKTRKEWKNIAKSGIEALDEAMAEIDRLEKVVNVVTKLYQDREKKLEGLNRPAEPAPVDRLPALSKDEIESLDMANVGKFEAQVNKYQFYRDEVRAFIIRLAYLSQCAHHVPNLLVKILNEAWELREKIGWGQGDCILHQDRRASDYGPLDYPVSDSLNAEEVTKLNEMGG